MRLTQTEAIRLMATSLERLATIAEKFYEAAHPNYDSQPDGQVTRVGDASATEPQTPEEYEAFPEDQPGRFEQLLRSARPQS